MRCSICCSNRSMSVVFMRLGSHLTTQPSTLPLNGYEQDGGWEARTWLETYTAGHKVEVRIESHDRYGRTVAELFLEGGEWVNLALVRAGMAWHFTKYSKSATLAEAERDARSARRGLWALAEPEAPWDFRGRGKSRGKLGVAAVAHMPISLASGPVIGNTRSKRYHLPGCPGYDQIPARNQVMFVSAELAQAAGFKLAGNCRDEASVRTQLPSQGDIQFVGSPTNEGPSHPGGSNAKERRRRAASAPQPIPGL